jgi:general L-amino acid transport system permease protein
MAQLILPLFLPDGMDVDRVLRAMVEMTLFSAAYLAENVRGGLQAIPKGQFEASHALGLSGAQTMIFIILPQALRLIIPILVGQFISVFKDTALVAIVGLFDLLGIARTVLSQPEFLGLHREVYAFVSLLYWVLSYAMSYISQRLETSLGIGTR